MPQRQISVIPTTSPTHVQCSNATLSFSTVPCVSSASSAQVLVSLRNSLSAHQARYHMYIVSVYCIYCVMVFVCKPDASPCVPQATSVSPSTSPTHIQCIKPIIDLDNTCTMQQCYHVAMLLCHCLLCHVRHLQALRKCLCPKGTLCHPIDLANTCTMKRC